MSHVVSTQNISYPSAAALVSAVVDDARAQGISVCVSVLDRSGVLKAFAQMDGVSHIAVKACQAKAYSALMGIGSQQLGEAVSDNLPQLVSLASFDNVVMMGGGLPIIIEGEVVGAIGVGGSSVDVDVACAEKALASLGL
jgi:uncharacterized protein GlcG (DUF336 family)